MPRSLEAPDKSMRETWKALSFPFDQPCGPRMTQRPGRDRHRRLVEHPDSTPND